MVPTTSGAVTVAAWVVLCGAGANQAGAMAREAAGFQCAAAREHGTILGGHGSDPPWSDAAPAYPAKGRDVAVDQLALVGRYCVRRSVWAARCSPQPRPDGTAPAPARPG